MKSSPLIGITTGSGDNFPGRHELYFLALKQRGAMSEFICPGSGRKGFADHYDGFLIPGGRDLNPMMYNEDQICTISPEEQKRTDFELCLLHEAAGRSVPVLGICYGMQLMNIYLKGTLFQDIGLQCAAVHDHREGNHGLTVNDNPFFRPGLYEVNSSHHQAVKEPGRGLVPFACSDDGIIEGFFAEGRRFWAGVQWHPERMNNVISEAVFDAFMEACRES